MPRGAASWGRLLGPGLTTLAALALLLGLGVWQVQRLRWKQGVLARIAAAEQAPAAPLTEPPEPYAKVVVAGRPRPDLAVLYGAQGHETPSGDRIGAQLIEPLERDGDVPVLVDLGWVPSTPVPFLPNAATSTELTGYVRPPDRPGWFSAVDDPTHRRVYTLDPAAIAAIVGLPRVAPFVVVALGEAPPAGYPDPARHLPRPPNDHLSYAITWFGLAAGLLVVFVLWSRKVLRA